MHSLSSVSQGRNSIGLRIVCVKIRVILLTQSHFVQQDPDKWELVGHIIEHCIQPRCLLSPMDADFCTHFIKLMHLQGTPGFSTIKCYDMVHAIHPLPSTRLTVGLFGRFWETTSKWSSSRVASMKSATTVRASFYDYMMAANWA